MLRWIRDKIAAMRGAKEHHWPHAAAKLHAAAERAAASIRRLSERAEGATIEEAIADASDEGEALAAGVEWGADLIAWAIDTIDDGDRRIRSLRDRVRALTAERIEARRRLVRALREIGLDVRGDALDVAGSAAAELRRLAASPDLGRCLAALTAEIVTRPTGAELAVALIRADECERRAVESSIEAGALAGDLARLRRLLRDASLEIARLRGEPTHLLALPGGKG